MTPPTHFAPPPGEVPTGNTPPHAGRDTVSQAIARALNQPVRVVTIDKEEGQALLVEPLRFHPVIRRHGRNVVRKSHVTLNSQGLQRDPN